MTVTLYHYTNMNGLRSIEKNGYIGLTMAFYEEIAHRVERLFELPVGSFDKNLAEIRKDSEANGRVSFFKFPNHGGYGEQLAKSNGEWKGLFVRECFKRACRIKKQKYDANAANTFLGKDFRPVVLKVKIPESYIDNIHQVSATGESEIYSCGLIPTRMIEEVQIVFSTKNYSLYSIAMSRDDF